MLKSNTTWLNYYPTVALVRSTSPPSWERRRPPPWAGSCGRRQLCFKLYFCLQMDCKMFEQSRRRGISFDTGRCGLFVHPRRKEIEISTSKQTRLRTPSYLRCWTFSQVVTWSWTDTISANRFRKVHLQTVAWCYWASWQVRIMMKVSLRQCVGVGVCVCVCPFVASVQTMYITQSDTCSSHLTTDPRSDSVDSRAFVRSWLSCYVLIQAAAWKTDSDATKGESWSDFCWIRSENLQKHSLSLGNLNTSCVVWLTIFALMGVTVSTSLAFTSAVT